MTTHPPCFLILTVGTGTAGKESNLAAGLRNTIEMTQPRKFWLIPSTNETSTTTADLIREGFDTFVPWSDTQPYLSIENPDSLAHSRSLVRTVIAVARKQLTSQETLIVNPTSGTKQMSAGATLAALDEGIGILHFTIGKRADGVVITGTEQIEAFNASEYFAERDLETARKLYQAGSLVAAASILERHPELAAQASIAKCCHEWERQNYVEARRITSQSHSESLVRLRPHLESLAIAGKKTEADPLIVADLLQTAEVWLSRNDTETTLTIACRALEMGLRLALARETGLVEPYQVTQIENLQLSIPLRERCVNPSRDGKTTILGLDNIARILQEKQNHIGESYFEIRGVRASVAIRNELMHQIRAVSSSEAQTALESISRMLEPLELPRPPHRPASL